MSSLEIRQHQFEEDLKSLEDGLNLGRSDYEGMVAVDSGNLIEANAIPNNLNESESVTVSKFWWGIDIKCNEKLTEDIITATATAGPIGTAIAAALVGAGVFTGGIATAIGAAFAAAFALKVAEIKIVNNGEGVHFPITWLQMAPVIMQIPMGPVAIIGAIMIFIHPVRN